VLFADRRDAGRALATRLRAYAHRDDVVVLGLPRGGVPVAYEVASALAAPLDVFVVRKLGVPRHEEYAMGAIASGGVRIVNHEVVRALGITAEALEKVAAREHIELERRERAFRGERPPLDPKDRIAILVDDGLATGSTMRAAVAALRAEKPARVVVAVPVGARQTCQALATEVDELVCASMPPDFVALSLWYRDFAQTDDDEVRDLLARAAAAHAEGARDAGKPAGRRSDLKAGS
jgi:predicted phosphoribosyltransferase